jgi:hypothetical protein
VVVAAAAAGDAAVRCATGARVDVARGGDTVSGRAGGDTVCAAGTAATRRTGAGSGPDPDPDELEDSGATGAAGASAVDHADAGSGSAASAIAVVGPAPHARRWTCRVGIAALDVRLGTGDGCATTIPAGPLGAAS